MNVFLVDDINELTGDDEDFSKVWLLERDTPFPNELILKDVSPNAGANTPLQVNIQPVFNGKIKFERFVKVCL